MMHRRVFQGWLAMGCLLAASWITPALADEAPDAMILKLSTEVLDTITLVDSRIMPNVNFQRMTAASVGPSWRQATPEQRKRLQDEFKVLLVRTYAGALAQVNDLSVSLKPMRSSPDDKEVVVRTEVKGKAQAEPIQLDYRLEKTPGDGRGWKIFNLNVMGVWLVETYRTQFAQEVNAHGIDGLIEFLSERNKAGGKKG
jgi:phospholipid transport system substrate-binding protein